MGVRVLPPGSVADPPARASRILRRFNQRHPEVDSAFPLVLRCLESPRTCPKPVRSYSGLIGKDHAARILGLTRRYLCRLVSRCLCCAAPHRQKSAQGLLESRLARRAGLDALYDICVFILCGWQFPALHGKCAGQTFGISHIRGVARLLRTLDGLLFRRLRHSLRSGSSALGPSLPEWSHIPPRRALLSLLRPIPQPTAMMI